MMHVGAEIKSTVGQSERCVFAVFRPPGNQHPSR